MLHFFLGIKRISEHYREDEVTVYAAQASFFIVLSAVPFIMLLLILIQFIPTISKADLMATLTQILPDMLDSLVVSVINDLSVKYPGTTLSIAAFTALWSAAKGMVGIERGLNRIYGTYRHRNFILSRLICAGYTLVFMIVCAVSLVLLVLGRSIQQLILRYLPILGHTVGLIIDLRSLFSIVLFFISFVGLYTILPRKRHTPDSQIPGALFSAFGWMLFSYAFSIYFTYFSNFSYMYGSLTAIMLMMLWLYFCICILFLGAEINAHLSRGNDNHSDKITGYWQV